MANYMNYLSGVGLYVLLILVLYGQKEILPKNVYKALDTDKISKPRHAPKGPNQKSSKRKSLNS